MKAFFWGGPRHGVMLYLPPNARFCDLPTTPNGPLPGSPQEDPSYGTTRYYRSRYFDDSETDTAIFLHEDSVEEEDVGRGLMRLLFAIAESEGLHLRDALTVINKAYEEISR